MASRLYSAAEEEVSNWEPAYLMALTVHKKHPTDWVCLNCYLHRRIPTNDFLFKIGRKENDNCTFCNNSSETLIYLFWSCHVTSSFLEKRDWLASKHSSDNWQIQLIEHHCTGFEARASFYRILVSNKLPSAASTALYLANQNGWNIACRIYSIKRCGVY